METLPKLACILAIILMIVIPVVSYMQNTVSIVVIKEGETTEYDEVKKSSIEIVYNGETYNITFKRHKDDIEYVLTDITEYEIKE